jgi:uncharacterized membrane protein
MANFCTECGKAVKPNANFCDNCGTRLVQVEQSTGSPGDIRFEEKRARVLGQNQSNNKPKFVLLGLAGIILVFGMVTLFNSLPSQANPIIEQQPTVTGAVEFPQSPTQMRSVQAKTENGKIILPLETVLEKKFVAFDYQSPNEVIPLLAYVSPEGKVITAVSMCEPCNSTRFHIRSDELICNSCGTTWELDNLSGISGACQKYPPDPLPSTIAGDEIQIDEAIVASWTPRK